MQWLFPIVQQFVFWILLVLTASIITFLVYLYSKFRKVVSSISSFSNVAELTMADYGSEGALASAAKRGSKKLLSGIIRNLLSRLSGGASEAISALIPDLDEWIDKNPYAILALIQNPQVQKIILKVGQAVAGQTQGSGASGTW